MDQCLYTHRFNRSAGTGGVLNTDQEMERRMADTDAEQTGPIDPQGDAPTEAGFLHMEAVQEDETKPQPLASVPAVVVRPAIPLTQQAQERAGTVEHLAARRPTPALDVEAPEVKDRLTQARSEITRLVTRYRWDGLSVEETATQLVPLLNVGPVQQWRPVLIPFLLEIDRAGNLVPVWLRIIAKGDPEDLPPDANPAETVEGRARRFAILMLGNYRAWSLMEKDTAKESIGFARQSSKEGGSKALDSIRVLGALAIDPNSSLYATQALVQLETNPALQALISALREAEGWAKVDIIDACLTLKQPRFNEMLVASGLDRVPGLESYIAIPIYRDIPLEDYLRGDSTTSPRLAQQAALIFGQVLLDSTQPPTDGQTLPSVFQRDMPPLAHILFEGARKSPTCDTPSAHAARSLLGRDSAWCREGRAHHRPDLRLRSHDARSGALDGRPRSRRAPGNASRWRRRVVYRHRARVGRATRAARNRPADRAHRGNEGTDGPCTGTRARSGLRHTGTPGRSARRRSHAPPRRAHGGDWSARELS